MNKFNTAAFFANAYNLRKEVISLLSSQDVDDRKLAERLNRTLPTGVRVPLTATAHAPMRWRIQ